MFAEHLFISLIWKTPKEWAALALDQFDEFLLDHASAERKANASCLMIATRYPDRRDVIELGLAMAAEELQHFREVVALLHDRGRRFEASRPDPYIDGLLGQLRNDRELWLLDRLLMSTIIEARGCERFGLLGDAMALDGRFAKAESPEPFRSEQSRSLADYYRELSRTEARHYGTYIRLAKAHFPTEVLQTRLREMIAREGEVLASLPLRPSLH